MVPDTQFPDAILDDDKPHDECGIFGIMDRESDVARATFFGLHALQHRGQESAGIAASNGRRIKVHADEGLVTQVFREEDLKSLWADLEASPELREGAQKTYAFLARWLRDSGLAGKA